MGHKTMDERLKEAEEYETRRMNSLDKKLVEKISNKLQIFLETLPIETQDEKKRYSSENFKRAAHKVYNLAIELDKKQYIHSTKNIFNKAVSYILYDCISVKERQYILPALKILDDYVHKHLDKVGIDSSSVKLEVY
jgi:hypothetical protein